MMLNGRSINTLTSAAARKARALMRARQGSVVIIFGLAMLPILLTLGAAVDYGRAQMTKSHLQASVDAAALAAAMGQYRGGNPARIAANYVTQQFYSGSLSVTTTTTMDAAQGTVTVRASATVPTSVMRIAKIDTLPVSASATAGMGAGGGRPAEIVIAFDTTGSMSGTKLTTAKQAANQLVDTLFAMPGSSNPNPNVKMGLVPFTDYVNIGLQYRNAAWLTNSDDFTTTGKNSCYDTYPNAIYTNPVFVPATCDNDGTSYDCSYTGYTVDYGAPVQVCTPDMWNGCVGSQITPNDENDNVSSANPVPALLNKSCSSPLIRLSNDPDTIKTAISAMSANGSTYIAPGLLWAWRVLSPDAPFFDGKAYNSAKKILVLMTDGANTRSANYPDHEARDAAAANTKLATTCANVKNAGIQLYTIAFDVTNTTIQGVLRQCASAPANYFNAQTNADLQTAFASIGMQVTQLRLVR
jgi:Flp pilus assembly protein TadG